MGTQPSAAAGSGFAEVFARRATELGFSLDPAQQRAAATFAALAAALSEGASGGGGWLPWKRRRTPARGLYLWGGVGRGKSFLMDTFFEHVAFSPKRRVHFHRFMREICKGGWSPWRRWRWAWPRRPGCFVWTSSRSPTSATPC
jgi:predicted ATPase